MKTKQKNKDIHIGIIPDGSRRWAKKNKIINYDGKLSGNVMDNTLIYIFEKYDNVKDISIWAVSTENMERPQKQMNYIYEVLEYEFNKLNNEKILFEKEIKVSVIGSRFNEFPNSVKNIAVKVIEKTKNHTKRNLNVCIGYGGKEEILNAVMSSLSWLKKNPTISKIHENIFEDFLMVPKPLDIVIRTGGEKRLSGFMMYQIEYAELFFVDTLWPDFTTTEIDDIIKQFNKRNRRFGK